ICSFCFQAEDGIRDRNVTGVQTCALPIEAGQTVYVETCPQYLLMDESRYSLPAEEARRYMIAPPLRKKKNQEILWEALKEGRIQTICTDHCSFTKEQKEAGAEDFAKTPCGMPGAEERPALIWQFGVNAGR